MKSNDTLIHAVDQLAIVRAQIADLKKTEEKLKSTLESSFGPDQVIDGDAFRATLVIQFRESLDTAKVREFLHPNQLRAATRVSEIHSIKLTARS